MAIASGDRACVLAVAYSSSVCGEHGPVRGAALPVCTGLGLDDAKDGQPVGLGAVPCRRGLHDHLCHLCQPGHAVGLPAIYTWPADGDLNEATKLVGLAESVLWW